MRLRCGGIAVCEARGKLMKVTLRSKSDHSDLFPDMLRRSRGALRPRFAKMSAL